MGKTKETKIIIVSLFVGVLSLVFGLQCKAQTVDDLYAVYGLATQNSVPDAVKETVMAYNSALVYAARYKNISAVVTDYTRTKQRIADYEDQIVRYSESLQDGYTLPISTILELESKIAYCEKQIAYLESSMNEAEVDVPSMEISDIPSKADYIRASEELENYSSYQLGVVDGVHYPVTGEILSFSATDQMAIFKIPEAASTLSLFHGVVAEVDGDYVRVSHGNNVYTEYFGLSTVGVSAGEELNQYQRIGSSRGQFQMSMNVNGKYKNLSFLLEGGSV